MATTTFSGPVVSQSGFDGAIGGTTPAAAVVTTLTASSTVIMSGLPTADPSVAGALWIDTGAARVVKVSAG